jgi:hypothetical protein
MSGKSLKKTIIYGGAFLLALFSINLGFYIVPVYRHAAQYTLLGPLTILLAYFVFGLPPVTLFFRGVVKDSWPRALLKALGTVLLCVIVMAGFAFIMMRSGGKV